MWTHELKESGFYWYVYKINEFERDTVCYFDFLSKSVTFIGSMESVPIQHLEELTGLWFGPITKPPLKDAL